MKKTPTAPIVILALAAIGTLVLVFSRTVVVEAVYPVERARQTFVRHVWSRIAGAFSGAAARAENVRLRREVAALSLARLDAERAAEENARLRTALAYRTKTPGTWVAAGVLSSDGGAAGAHATLRVDKGSLAGVGKGAVVVVPEGLVGRVTSVTPHTAEVSVLADAATKVACEVETAARRRPQGILCGGGGDVLLLRHLTDAAEVPPRSRVLTSGLGGVYPKGIAVGTLLDVRKSPGGLAGEGEVLPAVDFSTLEDVFIRCEKR